MNEKRPRGRPKSEGPTRDAEITFYLTPDDAQFWDGFARDLKFRSRSQLFTVIAERLVEGQLAPIVWLKLGLMIANRAGKYSRRKGGGYFPPWRQLLPLPDPEEPEPKQIEQALRIIRKELALEKV